LIQAFAKNKKVDILDLRKDSRLYQIPERFKEFQ